MMLCCFPVFPHFQHFIIVHDVFDLVNKAIRQTSSTCATIWHREKGTPPNPDVYPGLNPDSDLIFTQVVLRILASWRNIRRVRSGNPILLSSLMSVP